MPARGGRNERMTPAGLTKARITNYASVCYTLGRCTGSVLSVNYVPLRGLLFIGRSAVYIAESRERSGLCRTKKDEFRSRAIISPVVFNCCLLFELGNPRRISHMRADSFIFLSA